MVGVIRTRHVLAHPYLVVRSYGWRLFLAALVCRQGTTFLTLAWRYA